ncbi:YIPF1-like protein, partial [Trifolium medium]|nr:YIPF1-like protein [Trifolium medium]
SLIFKPDASPSGTVPESVAQIRVGCVEGGGWRCRRRLFAWEEESLLECIGMSVNVFLQVNTENRWKWRLDQTGHYSFKGVYKFFVHDSLSSEPEFQNVKDIMRNKLAPLKVLVFAWKLLKN